MQTHKLLGCALLVAGCSTSSSSDDLVPSATNTPNLKTMSAAVACGQDIAFYGAATPDLRYAFTFDDLRLTHAEGTWLESGTVDTSDYTWSGDDLTHILSTSGWDGSTAEVSAAYGANGLTSYTYAYATPDGSAAWTYAFSNFIAPNQPGRETITAGTDSLGYDLIYDANDRLVAAVPDTGASTTWTYDDTARTITMDTGNGAFTGVISYDAQFRETSTVYGGSDPSVIDYDETYAWNGGDLATITYRSGSEQAPHQLEVFQTDTMRYDCAMARQLAGRSSRMSRVMPLRR